jgi:hypothetical protein
MTQRQLWVLRKASPWGDYGSILVHGMSAHLARSAGRIQLERTGPFIPPVTLPGIGDIVVTARARAELEQHGILGLEFLPVEKTRIVVFDWQAWDWADSKPAEYPESGEPEDYILSRPHDPYWAGEMGDLFEIVPVRGGLAAREELEPRRDLRRQPRDLRPKNYQFTIEPATIPSVDIFRAENMRYVFVTERLRAVLASMSDNACTFQEVSIGPVPPPQLPLRRYLAAGEDVPPEYELTGTMVSPFTGELMRIASLRR